VNEFISGLEILLRPGNETSAPPTRCPWGHDLRIGGCSSGWETSYRTTLLHCRACTALPDAGRRAGTWALVDPSTAAQVTEGKVKGSGLHLVAVRPAVEAGPGVIQLRQGEVLYGSAEVLLCRICRRAILSWVEVAQQWRRRGAGWVLVAAAAARGTGYSWSTTPFDIDPGTVAFWATIAIDLGDPVPRPCSHIVASGWSHPAMTEEGLEPWRAQPQHRSLAQHLHAQADMDGRG
jgi:hypothetical protein